jgi:hypothetical protein
MLLWNFHNRHYRGTLELWSGIRRPIPIPAGVADRTGDPIQRQPRVGNSGGDSLGSCGLQHHILSLG